MERGSVVVKAGILPAVACGLACAWQMWLSLAADRSGEPEEAFHHAVHAGVLGLALLALGGAVWFIRSRQRSARHTGTEGAAPDQAVGATLAGISVLAGLLCWVPLLPLVVPVAYAGAALVVGLFGMRALGSKSPRRDWVLAGLGVILGAAYVGFYFVGSLATRR